MKARSVVFASSLLFALAAQAAQAPATSGPDEAWTVTATMSMTKPMAMTMPAGSHDTCVAPGADQKPPDLHGADCKMTRFDKQGQRVTYAATCHMQGGDVTGNGWTEHQDDAHYTGEMNVSGTVNGMPMAMQMTYSGVRTGHCTAQSAP